MNVIRPDCGCLRKLLPPVLLAGLLSSAGGAQAFRFPEIPFCPLGGPPGWANRLMHDKVYRYPPPVYYGRTYPDYRQRGYSPWPRVSGHKPLCRSGNGYCPVTRR